MHFTHAVAIVISGECAPSMVDALMRIAPSLKTGIHAVRICVHEAAGLYGVFDEWLNGLLHHIPLRWRGSPLAFFSYATTQRSRHLRGITLIDGQLVGNLLVRQVESHE